MAITKFDQLPRASPAWPVNVNPTHAHNTYETWLVYAPGLEEKFHGFGTNHMKENDQNFMYPAW
jgi:hypothetical protein